MYLSRLTLNRSRMAVLWMSNPYRVHQRLKMACDHDPRLLFRIEDTQDGTQILVQSHNQPDWEAAFKDFPVLQTPPEWKPYDPALQPGQRCRFRLLANPTVKKTQEVDGQAKKARLGLLREADQIAWLERKLTASGGEVLACRVAPHGLQHSRKHPADDNGQTHLAVQFEGLLLVRDPALLQACLESGVGPAKGFGFGLLSLAPVG